MKPEDNTTPSALNGVGASPCVRPVSHVDWPAGRTQGDAPTPQENKLYPIFLDLEGKVGIVVGGGQVAVRKVHSLLPTGARIVVISASLHSDLQALLDQALIEHIPHNYATEYLAGATIVFATTNDPEVNRHIAHDAQERGLWVNIADNPDGSDFHVPATIRRSALTLAISTAGSAPAFARYVRNLLEQTFTEALGQTLELIAPVRPLILAQAKEKQAQLWESLLALHLEKIIETQGYPAAQQILEDWLAQNTIQYST